MSQQVAGYPFKADSHAGSEFADARRWLIAHNTFAFNQNRGGIVVWQRGATDCMIQNNIFYRNAVTLSGGAIQGIDFADAGGAHIVRNNLFYGPDRVAMDKADPEYKAANNLEKDPLFVAPEQLDFHLAKG